MLEAVDGDVVLSIELYEAYGGLTSPGSAPLTVTETSYETCGTCLILGMECVEHGDHFDCNRVFMPRHKDPIAVKVVTMLDALHAQNQARSTGLVARLSHCQRR